MLTVIKFVANIHKRVFLSFISSNVHNSLCSSLLKVSNERKHLQSYRIIADIQKVNSLIGTSYLWRKQFIFFGNLMSTHTKRMTSQKQPEDGYSYMLKLSFFLTFASSSYLRSFRSPKDGSHPALNNALST